MLNGVSGLRGREFHCVGGPRGEKYSALFLMFGGVLCCGVSARYSLPHFPILVPREEKENSCPLFLLLCTSTPQQHSGEGSER